ncbi:hypothetical protein AgCh_010082 [Apium graveolens]
MYAVSGLVDEAHQVFDRMCQRYVYAFPWNALISGYAELGQFDAALALYFQMVEDGVEPDGFTFPRVLKACGGIGMIHVGEEVHRHIIRLGLRNDGYILNGLVDMYAKCGDIVKARKLFDGIVCKNLVSWNIMLTGYIRHELLHEALHVFQLMIKDAFEPDSVAISTILACGMPRKFGAQIHGRVLRRGAESYLSVANSLIVLYSNNNRLDCATWLFDQMYERDVVSWNSIISAYCKRSEALLYFESMRKTNIFPDRVTFVSLLSTCAHLGMVKDGDMLFTMMRDEYKITPVMEHYACMVNLYGRAGMIEEAYDMIMNQMEIKAGPTVWGALLYACYLHGNVDVGEIAAASLFELESDNEHNFEILMNIYKNSGRLEGVQRIKLMIEERGQTESEVVLNRISGPVSNQQNRELLGVVTHKEVKNAAFHMHPDKVETGEARKVMELLSSYEKPSGQRINRGDGAIFWVKPHHNEVNITVDATIFEDQGASGIGLLARNDEGHFFREKTICFLEAMNLALAEAITVKEILSWATEMMRTAVIVKLDCLEVFQLDLEGNELFGAQALATANAHFQGAIHQAKAWKVGLEDANKKLEEANQRIEALEAQLASSTSDLETARAEYVILKAQKDKAFDGWMDTQEFNDLMVEHDALLHPVSYKEGWDAAVEAIQDEFPEVFEQSSFPCPVRVPALGGVTDKLADLIKDGPSGSQGQKRKDLESSSGEEEASSEEESEPVAKKVRVEEPPRAAPQKPASPTASKASEGSSDGTSTGTTETSEGMTKTSEETSDSGSDESQPSKA